MSDAPRHTPDPDPPPVTPIAQPPSAVARPPLRVAEPEPVQPGIRVLSFGPNALPDAAGVRRLATTLGRTRGQRLVVVPAFAGVEDALRAAARLAASGDAASAYERVEQLSARHLAIAGELLGESLIERVREELALLVDETLALLGTASMLRECTPRAIDAILSHGERAAAPIVAAALAEADVADSVALPGHGLIIVSPAGASPLMEETRALAAERIAPLLQDGTVPIVSGSIASTTEGWLVRLGLDGTHRSAALLAAALGAVELIVMAKPDALRRADPALVPDAGPIVSLSLAEATLLGIGTGMPALDLLVVALDSGATVRMMDSDDPTDAGVSITTDAPDRMLLRGVRAETGLALARFSTDGASPIADTSGWTIGSLGASRTARLLTADEGARLAETDPAADIQTPVALLSAVGEGLRSASSAARLYDALVLAGVSLLGAIHPPGEPVVGLIVPEEDLAKAARALEKGLFSL